MEDETIDGLTFEQWIAKIDALFKKEFILGYEDFPDWGYYDSWADGLTPEETFQDWKDEYYPE